MNSTAISNKSLQMESDVEQFLSAYLNPVEPKPEFVDRLRHRFQTRPVMVLEHRTFWGVYLIAAGGLFFGALLAWLAQRTAGLRR